MATPAAEGGALHPLFQHEIFNHPALQPLRDPVILAAVAGLLVLLLVFACAPSGKKNTGRGTPTVLLVGPPDSGKTALFTKIAQDERPATLTSVVPSSATVSLPGDGRRKAVRIVDLAGHARLRDQVGRHVETADAVVFVVDIVALVRNAAAVAEELPPLLTQLAGTASRRGLSAPPLRLLLLAHKSDLLSRSATDMEISSTARATASERVRSILTREMDRLKAARGAGGVGGRIEGMAKVQSGGRGWWARLFGLSAEPEAAAEDDEALVWGQAGPWRWDDVEGVEVAWGVSAVGQPEKEAAAERRGNGLDELTDFMWGL